MQAADRVGPKILFDFSQVEAGFPVRYLRCCLDGKARVRHPGIHLPNGDMGKSIIQARVSASPLPGLRYSTNSGRPFRTMDTTMKASFQVFLCGCLLSMSSILPAADHASQPQGADVATVASE